MNSSQSARARLLLCGLLIVLIALIIAATYPWQKPGPARTATTNDSDNAAAQTTARNDRAMPLPPPPVEKVHPYSSED